MRRGEQSQRVYVTEEEKKSWAAVGWGEREIQYIQYPRQKDV